MASATFDTLKHANALKAAGMPSDQAEALIASLSEVFQLNFKELATKEDVQRASAEIRQELNAKIDTSTAKNDGQFTLMRWMLGINLTVTTGILIRLFFFRP